MSVREGYKMTELGEIPVDWNFCKLKEYCNFKQGYQIPFKEQNDYLKDGYIRYLYITDFFSNKRTLYIKDDVKYDHITQEDIAVANTGNTSGKSFRGAKGVLSNNMFKICFQDKVLDGNFIFSFLQSELYWKQLYKYFNTAGQPHLGHKNMGEILFPIAPLPEQQKIAEILSTNDELISKTDEMLEKTKEIKKGLMQELLTKGIGHTEFKDSELGRIPKSWEVKRLVDVVVVNPNYKLLRGKIYDFVEMASLPTEGKYINKIKEREYGVNSGSKFKNGDTLFARITPCTENGKTALVSGLSTENGLGSTEFIVLSPKEKIVNNEYLFYWCKSEYVRNYAIDRMIGTTGRQRVPNEVFKEELGFQLPPLPEQQQIADILTSVDNKIETLTKRKQKLEEIKKGLMQDLLTGRVRVKLD